MKSHRYLVDHPQEGLAFYVPDWWEIEHHHPDSPMDQTIESMHTIAWIKQNHLKQPEEAERIYQEIVDRYGLLIRNGPAIAECLHELGKKPVTARKAALVWGGRDTTQKTWDAVLGPMGFKTHMVAQYTVSEAHLRRIRSWSWPGPG